MNCRPGDIARCVLPGDFYGALFSIIKAAPVDVQFVLPNGVLNRRTGPGRWVVESLGSEVPTYYWKDGVPSRITTRFGVMRDEHLRPIRDNPGEDETLIWAGKPADIKTPEAA